MLVIYHKNFLSKKKSILKYLVQNKEIIQFQSVQKWWSSWTYRNVRNIKIDISCKHQLEKATRKHNFFQTYEMPLLSNSRFHLNLRSKSAKSIGIVDISTAYLLIKAFSKDKFGNNRVSNVVDTSLGTFLFRRLEQSSSQDFNEWKF